LAQLEKLPKLTPEQQKELENLKGRASEVSEQIEYYRKPQSNNASTTAATPALAADDDDKQKQTPTEKRELKNQQERQPTAQSTAEQDESARLIYNAAQEQLAKNQAQEISEVEDLDALLKENADKIKAIEGKGAFLSREDRREMAALKAERRGLENEKKKEAEQQLQPVISPQQQELDKLIKKRDSNWTYYGKSSTAQAEIRRELDAEIAKKQAEIDGGAGQQQQQQPVEYKQQKATNAVYAAVTQQLPRVTQEAVEEVQKTAEVKISASEPTKTPGEEKKPDEVKTSDARKQTDPEQNVIKTSTAEVVKAKTPGEAKKPDEVKTSDARKQTKVELRTGLTELEEQTLEYSKSFIKAPKSEYLKVQPLQEEAGAIAEKLKKIIEDRPKNYPMGLNGAKGESYKSMVEKLVGLEKRIEMLTNQYNEADEWQKKILNQNYEQEEKNKKNAQQVSQNEALQPSQTLERITAQAPATFDNPAIQTTNSGLESLIAQFTQSMMSYMSTLAAQNGNIAESLTAFNSTTSQLNSTVTRTINGSGGQA
jgi:hypothetical protein